MNNFVRIEKKKQSRLAKNIRFLQSALDTNGYRPQFQKCFVDDGKIIATDGKRMHIMKVFDEDMKEGFYNIDIGKDAIVLSFDEKEGNDFLNWKKVYDSTLENTHIGDFDFCQRNVYLNSRGIGSFLLKSNSVVDLKFLSDMSGYVWECYFLNHDKAIRFVNVADNIEAIIMPMQKD